MMVEVLEAYTPLPENTYVCVERERERERERWVLCSLHLVVKIGPHPRLAF